MSPQPKKGKPAGEARVSQILNVFGPGAMVDLPEHSVVIGGLEFWRGDMREILEERLAGRVAQLLELDSVELREPPVDEDERGALRTGIDALVFPEWFVAQHAVVTGQRNGRQVRSRALVHWRALQKRQYVDDDGARHPVVPVRFVQACRNGHLSDIRWIHFVHGEDDLVCRGPLQLDELGAGGDLQQIRVRCRTCRRERPLSDMKVNDSQVLGRCQGQRPWLGFHASETCQKADAREPETNRLLTRTASNAYFSQVLSVISIPDDDAALKRGVQALWEGYLQGMGSREKLESLLGLGLGPVDEHLGAFDVGRVWEEIEARRSGRAAATPSIKSLEFDTLMRVGVDAPRSLDEHDFVARRRPLDGLPAWLADKLDRVVLVEKLREVRAQVGFTRFEPMMPDIDGDLDLGVRRASLADTIRWVPAVEHFGEGVFVAFRPAALDAWRARPEVVERGRALQAAFAVWAQDRKIPPEQWPGVDYLMAHSLAHLLITSVSLECGYAASSIRERVYRTTGGLGLLLYTGSAGSEGTLGGLVDVGRSIERHIPAALARARLCSNDPICAEHQPAEKNEERYLHGAVCHGCLLVPETSCERGNAHLDRALVVPTVATPGAAFFLDAPI